MNNILCIFRYFPIAIAAVYVAVNIQMNMIWSEQQQGGHASKPLNHAATISKDV